MEKCHLIGIAGMGMSALAQVLLGAGWTVSGSDRSYDSKDNQDLAAKLRHQGINIFPQDGTGIDRDINRIIISPAIEKNNPDFVKAKKLGIPVFYRQEIVKEIVSKRHTIAVAGTSGKTTVVGMIGCIFNAVARDVTIINGGIMNNYLSERIIGNVRVGKDKLVCVETDESEGDLRGYKPEIGVVNNIGYDHMPHTDLVRVYREFAAEVKNILIINSDSDCGLRHKHKFSYGIENKADFLAKKIELFPHRSVFVLNNEKVKVPVPGIHNVYNSLAALSVVCNCGIPLKEAIAGLAEFKGIRQRYEFIDKIEGVTIICDYAHNPDKIKAALMTARTGAKRIIAVYQPHGYGPTKMFLNELADVFAKKLNENDLLFISDIFYAGGSVEKVVSADDLVAAIKKRNPKLNVSHLSNKEDIASRIASVARPKDLLLVMGARDSTLSSWAANILLNSALS